MFPEKSPSVDAQRLEQALANVQAYTWDPVTKQTRLATVFGLVDLTTLEGSDTDERVRQLCAQTQYQCEATGQTLHVAAVCVYPTLIAVAKQTLASSPVKVAAVAGAFPSSQAPLALKLQEVTYAIEQGADEIDVALSRGRFLQGDHRFVYDEIAAIKQCCDHVPLKVILEIGELESLDQVRRASDLAMAAGADFIKTSTGKIKGVATLPATWVMLDAIRDHHLRTGQSIGIKPSGGISDATVALTYLQLVEDVLGTDWLNPERMRFGASRLVSALVSELRSSEA